MKVEIHNLGVINSASIELKPLTVFIGENSTGKTWAAYTLSAILGQHGYQKYLKAFSEGKTQQTYPPLDHAISHLLDDGNAQIDLVQFAKDYAEAYFNDVASLAPRWMETLMATKRVTFEALQVHINLAQSKTAFLEKITATAIERQLSVGSHRQGALLNALKEAGETTLYFYSEGEALKKLPHRAVKKFMAAQLFQTLHRIFYSEVYILPTERTGFIISPLSLEQAFEETTETAHEQHSASQIFVDKNLGNLAEPVKRFVGMIGTSATTNVAERNEQINDNPKMSVYVKLAAFLETEILRGKVDFETFGLQKELLFQPLDNSHKLEMSVVSAMVKELAPLVLFLRYLVEPNDWIIIDEPEMNLHPAVQVELIEFLGMLVNAGLQVLITTHSPYIVDHLANLITAAKHDNKDKIKELFYLEQTDAFVSQEQTSVYQFDEGTTRNLIDEEGILDWSTFGDVSSDVSHIYPHLLPAL
jgi:hypothetical protein